MRRKEIFVKMHFFFSFFFGWGRFTCNRETWNMLQQRVRLSFLFTELILSYRTCIGVSISIRLRALTSVGE